MNQIELARLASVAHEYRPDWPKQSILTLLHPLSMRAYTDVAVAMAVCFTDPETETPKRLLEDGPWWKATRLAGGSVPQPAPYQVPLPLTDEERAASSKAYAECRRALNEARKETVQ